MKMKSNEPIYKAYWDVLQEIKKQVYFDGEFNTIVFKPANQEQRDVLTKLQETHGAIKLLLPSKKLNFDSLLSGEYIYPAAVMLEIIPDKFNKIYRECEGFFNNNQGDITPPDDVKSLFGFEGKKFWLKRIAGQDLTISFYPKKGETTDPFCLMQAFIDYIRNGKLSKDGWLTAVMPSEEVVGYIKRNHSSINSNDWGRWLSSTKSNLLKKLTDEDKNLVVFDDYDNKKGGYPLSIKLALKSSTP